MATQLKADPEPIIEEEGDGGSDIVDRDYEAEARAHGWVPKDEFLAKPNAHESRWVDAETFARRADEVMPLLKKQNERLTRELAEVKKQARRITDHFNKAEERIRDELVAKMEEAVKTGDVAAFRKLKTEADDLTKEAAKPEYSKEEAMDAFEAFRDVCTWYDKANLASASELEINARLYADRMTEKHLAKTEEMAPSDFFGMIQGLVEEKYPAITAKAPRQKPPSDVAGTTQNRNPGPRGKTFNDLPVEAQRMADKWIAQKLIPDRAAYVKSYDWS